MNTRIRFGLAFVGTVWGVAAFAQAASNVYVPLSARCRVADSRTQNPPIYTGTPLAAAETRGINILNAGSYVLQGGMGSHSTCGIPNNATAITASLTVLPVGTSGFLKMFRGGGSWQDGNTVNFTSETPITNDVIVPINSAITLDAALYANVPTHYVVDVVGYFRAPQTTCTNVTESVAVTAGTGTGAVSVACPAGTKVEQPACIAGVHVLKTSWSYNAGDTVIFGPASTAGHLCMFGNLTASPDTITAKASCCTLPQ